MATPEAKRKRNAKKNAKRKLRRLEGKLGPQVLSGHGDYFSDLKAAIKPVVKGALTSALTSAGGMLGDKVGLRGQGRDAGSYLANKLSKLIGSGDYTMGDDVKTNSLMLGKPSANASFGQSKSRIVRREYVCDVVTGTAAGQFNNVTYAVNPNNAQLFSMLSAEAQCYEKYRFRGLVFELVSETSPNVAVGSWGLALSNNPAATAFVSKGALANSDEALTERLDKSILYPIECLDQTENWYWVKQPGITLPVSETDFGLLQVMTMPAASVGANATVGELWVSYDVEFDASREPVGKYGYLHFGWNSNLLSQPNQSIAYGSMSGSSYVPSTVANGYILMPNLDGGDHFVVTCQVTGTGLGGLSLVPGTGMAADSIVANRSVSSGIVNSATQCAGSVFMNCSVSGNANGFTINLSSFTSATSVDIFITTTEAGYGASIL